MSDLGPNTASSSISKAKVGRKPKTDLPPDSKERKNLEAVRKFRERKQNYLKGLEQEVEELRAIVNGGSVLAGTPPVASNALEVQNLRSQVINLQSQLSAATSGGPSDVALVETLKKQNLALQTQLSIFKQSGGVSIDFTSTLNNPNNPNQFIHGVECIGCSVERMKTLVCMGQIKDLEGKLTEAQGELQTLRSLQGLAQLFSFNGIDSLGLQQQQLNQPPFQYSQSASDMFPPDFGLLTGMQQMSPAIPNSSPQTSNGMSPWIDHLLGGPNTSSTTPNSSSNINLPSENSIPKKPSANDLYGQPEVDFVRIALKSLPSLKESKYVDLLMDLFLLQCEATDKKWMVKSMLKMMNLRHKLLDSCNVMDRQKVLELLVIFSERNKNHMMHRNSMIHEGFTRFSSGAAAHKASQEAAAAGSSSSSASDNVRVKKEPSALQKKLDEQLLKIPSLRNAGALIRQLGDEIHAVELWNQLKKEEALIEMMRIGKQLEEMCTTMEEKRQFAMISESFREGNRQHLDRLYEDMDSE